MEAVQLSLFDMMTAALSTPKKPRKQKRNYGR